MHFIKWMNDDWLHMELRKLGISVPFPCTCGFDGVGGGGGSWGCCEFNLSCTLELCGTFKHFEGLKIHRYYTYSAYS